MRVPTVATNTWTHIGRGEAHAGHGMCIRTRTHNRHNSFTPADHDHVQWCCQTKMWETVACVHTLSSPNRDPQCRSADVSTFCLCWQPPHTPQHTHTHTHTLTHTHTHRVPLIFCPPEDTKANATPEGRSTLLDTCSGHSGSGRHEKRDESMWGNEKQELCKTNHAAQLRHTISMPLFECAKLANSTFWIGILSVCFAFVQKVSIMTHV